MVILDMLRVFLLEITYSICFLFVITNFNMYQVVGILIFKLGARAAFFVLVLAVYKAETNTVYYDDVFVLFLLF